MWVASHRDPVLDEVPAGRPAHYRGLQLTYDKVPEASFDPIGNPRLLRQFVRHALLYLLVYSSAALIFGIALLIVGTGIGFRTAITVWWIGAAATGFLFLCLFWLIPVPAQRRGNDLCVSLRCDYARAMREAVHSATQEGVGVAIGQERPQGQGIGSELQVAVADIDG